MRLFTRKRRVTMSVSVGDHVAGQSYRLPVALADSYVAKGYAEGGLSREFSPDELNELRSTMQTVSFDG